MHSGIYIHVPFCISKCPYCDFYSLTGAPDALKDAYTAALVREMQKKAGIAADTLYFGGGTPALLGGERLAQLVHTARACFGLPQHAEITLEANPADDLQAIFERFAAAGGNRLSIGMQSASLQVLHALGRRHTPQDVYRTVQAARAAGIDNISLDMMLAVPRQALQNIREDVAVCADLGASHVSAYLLKIEADTPYFEQQSMLQLPDEDATAEMYLEAVNALREKGYIQYEISNFAKPGYESRHNLKYWDGAPYLGFGPAAHSFFDRKRYYYPRDIHAFIDGNTPVLDEDAQIEVGGETEYAVFRLRLTEGLTEQAFSERFGKPLPRAWRTAAKALPPHLVMVNDDGISFTPEGFLVSNVLITRILNL